MDYFESDPQKKNMASATSSSKPRPCLDLGSPQFDAEFYVQDLLKRRSLDELVAVEQDMVNNVRRLDSEMQSLVYENYSKFLNATSTVRDMQSRLDDTHSGMRDLSTRMKYIADLSDSLTEKFSKNCETVKRLNDAKDSVKRLEFLIKTPQLLQKCIDDNQFSKAVNTYVAVKPILGKFEHIMSMKGIATDAEHIIQQLIERLRESLNGRLISSEETIEAVTLLKRLGSNEQELESILLANWESELSVELDQLDANSKANSSRYKDIFEFVDVGCCHYLTNLSLIASTFSQLFIKQTFRAELVQLLERTMGRFEEIANKRFGAEDGVSACALFVKALDRIYRKISVLSRLSSGYNFSRLNAEIVQKNARHQIAVCRRSVLNSFHNTSEELFAQLHHFPPAPSSSQSDTGRTFQSPGGIRHDRKDKLKKTLEKLEYAFIHSIKSVLAALLMFTASDIIFSTIPHFQSIFGFDVHEQLIVGLVKDLIGEMNKRVSEEVESNDQLTSTKQSSELIVLATFLRNLHLKHLEYLLELCREQYRLNELAAEQHKRSLTPFSDLVDGIKGTIEILLRSYVEAESTELIQMAKRSIDVFDWNGCSESPRHVRSLIKHLAHSVEQINQDLCVFMDDGGLAKQKERTPDSLIGYSAMRRAASATSSVYNDASSVSSGGIVERLWGESEATEDGAPVESISTLPIEFRRDVIMSAIVRLLLRGICDFVRNQKFSRQGLEQLQVDCAFVRQKLWYFVTDEHMLNTYIEDIVTAAVSQCAQPKLLDPSVVRSICEEC